VSASPSSSSACPPDERARQTSRPAIEAEELEEARRDRDRREYDRKPWWFRFGVGLARLTAPIQ
jgi:hypothetical protein